MGSSIWNMLFGVVAIAGGLSGKLVLLGTNSSMLLVVLGVALFGYGVYGFVRSRRQGG